MIIPCQIDNVKTLKNGMKITLSVDKENTLNVMRNIHGFIDKPVKVEMLVDVETVKERMKYLNDDQRKKIYAILNDISVTTNNHKEAVKEELKIQFIQEYGQYEMFSLSNCSKELASDFIDFLIGFAFEFGIPLTDKPKNYFDDIERYIEVCNKKKVCVVCGMHGELHHMTGSRVGMGNNRKKINNEGRRLICLCRKHHSELHNMPEEEFFKKYHLEV
jgi:hypothetical protein